MSDRRWGLGVAGFDNIPLPSNAGNFYVEASVKSKPGEGAGGFLAGRSLPVNQVVLKNANAFVINPLRKEVKYHGLLLAKNYSAFMLADNEVPDAGSISAAIVGLLADVTPFVNIFQADHLKTAFAEAGYNLTYSEYTTDAHFETLATDPGVLRVLDLFSPQYRRVFLSDRREQILMIGPILLTMTKTINPQGYQNWLKNRIKTFRGVLGITDSECIWTDAQFPTQGAMQTCNTLLSAMFTMRRDLFMICVSLTVGQRFENRLFQEIVNFSQGAEMGHIMMIDQHIFGHFPEFLRLRLLRDNLASVRAAWEFLNRIPPELRYFTRILYPKDQATLLTRIHFGPLAQVATTIGQFTSQSMKYYRGGQTDQMSNQLAIAVRTYLERRIANIAYAVRDTRFSYFGPHEAEVYDRQVRSVGIGGFPAQAEGSVDHEDNVGIPVPVLPGVLGTNQ